MLTHKQLSMLYRIASEVIFDNTTQNAIDILTNLSARREEVNDFASAEVYQEVIARLQDANIIREDQKLEEL